MRLCKLIAGALLGLRGDRRAGAGRRGLPHRPELVRRGVRFEVCDITLKNRNLQRSQFISEATFTPSGVVRLAKLQREGAAYIKP